jgi:hypothetical protein
MAIVIEDAQMEQLAEQIAVAEGVSVAEVLREGLLSLAGQRGLATHKAPLRERRARAGSRRCSRAGAGGHTKRRGDPGL